MDDFLLKMENIDKRFPGVIALDNVHLEVKKGEVHILVGENGAGKSTLVKILAGAYTKDRGTITLEGKNIEITSPKHAQTLGISIIYQELCLLPQLTVAENIFLGREIKSKKFKHKIDWKSLFTKSQEILNSLHVEINSKTKVKDLGIAQQQMVEVAKALSYKSKIIIMDEPTAALTNKEIDNLFNIIEGIKRQGVSIIYISHRLEEFSRIGDRVTVMRDGKTIDTLEIKNADINKLIQLMVGRELKEKFPRIKVERGPEIFRVNGLNRKDVLEDINFNLYEGEILGISGLVGAGRTELARAVFGLDKLTSGEVILNGKKILIHSPSDAIKNGIGFVTEDRKGEGLILGMNVGSNITLANLKSFQRLFHLDLIKEFLSIKDFIKKLKIKTPSANQKVMNLSGGNQQKVVLAKWLLSRSKILIFDEPTRGIDVNAKIEVYNLMNEIIANGGSIILISSELPEILGMSDRILVMRRGKINKELINKNISQEEVLYYSTISNEKGDFNG